MSIPLKQTSSGSPSFTSIPTLRVSPSFSGFRRGRASLLGGASDPPHLKTMSAKTVAEAKAWSTDVHGPTSYARGNLIDKSRRGATTLAWQSQRLKQRELLVPTRQGWQAQSQGQSQGQAQGRVSKPKPNPNLAHDETESKHLPVSCSW